MEPADFYSGIVVDAYAKLKSTSFDAEPYLRFVQAHGEPGLEIGCGDGEPLLDLCAAGLEVEGVDSSGDMVERCRQNAARRGIGVQVFHQRVQELRLDRRYASIYFAGPTFNLLADDGTALRALVAIRAHLTDDGAALIPLWVPDPTPADELGVTRATNDEADVELRYTPLSESYDVERRTRVTTARYERITAQGTELADREWVVHWHTPSSFRRLCADAGLQVAGLVDDDTGGLAAEGSTSFTATVRRSAEARR
ncbi:class I SAM-dependent methyltransferase [Kribbella sp. CA-293567]|uniref:class I SAM-dependent methyltransferase n=1 Tax=Kribbella sp. CA-293567 TaxID=3002436 RepID=UPI0022DE84A1|nr:class I SAM-dependent methyltransferase [Kribbella sp. CA-293567]WBQ02676.1 class I SAM-dependent methyltransferase [Kribbella sp. CA-293567]